ncbi:MAG: hypothetical protein WCS70_00780 [Verrucomicrobiota bacterium]
MIRLLGFWVLALLLAGCSSTSPSNTGIKYKTATPEVNEQARNAITQCFGSNVSWDKCDSLLTTAVTIGPGLWNDIKDHPALKGITFGVGHFNIPIGQPSRRMLSMEGRIVQNETEARAFLTAISATFQFAEKPVVRNLTEEEKRIYWAMIPFPIEEPVFVIDGGQYALLVDISMKEGVPHIFWMDDFVGLKSAPQREQTVDQMLKELSK